MRIIVIGAGIGGLAAASVSSSWRPHGGGRTITSFTILLAPARATSIGSRLLRRMAHRVVDRQGRGGGCAQGIRGMVGR
jgi:hypothetical protein